MKNLLVYIVIFIFDDFVISIINSKSIEGKYKIRSIVHVLRENE